VLTDQHLNDSHCVLLALGAILFASHPIPFSAPLVLLSRKVSIMNRDNLVAGLALSLTVLSAYGADDLPNGAVRITTEELQWHPGRVPGHEIAPLIGDSTKPGPYVERVKFPANSVSQAHSHPDDRTYTVISGTWYVGYGDKLDPAKLKALPPGSYYTEPANVNHFSVIKEDPVVVQITGTGTTATRFFDPAFAPKK
jgi:quercetin dioxygenase-like cupin family protein